MREIEQLTLFARQENLRDGSSLEERMELEAKEAAIRKFRKGKKAFILTYERGAYSQEVPWTKYQKEIWAKNAVAAAELACAFMIKTESTWVLNSALTCTLDVSAEDQLQEHTPILVNPYGIAPSQQADGGPWGFAEALLGSLTGKNISLDKHGKIEVTPSAV